MRLALIRFAERADMGNITVPPPKWPDAHSAPKGIGLAIASVRSRGAERGRAPFVSTPSTGAPTARGTTVRGRPSARREREQLRIVPRGVVLNVVDIAVYSSFIVLVIPVAVLPTALSLYTRYTLPNVVLGRVRSSDSP